MSGEQLRVAVLAGGRSAEHEVSLSSAESIREGLQAAGHEVLWVEISRDGRWLLDGETVLLAPGAGLLGADVAFPALHGPGGEDGSVQGTLEVLDLPYVGAGVSASAACLDKVMFKELMSAAGVPQVDYVGLRERRWLEAPAEALSQIGDLGLPVFVKPAHLGSSLGIERVTDAAALSESLQRAFRHDELVIVETAATGMEVECAVLELPTEASPSAPSAPVGWRVGAAGAGAGLAHAIVSPPGRVGFGGDWYDFESKYAPGAMELLVPAPISETAGEAVQRLALGVFERVGCEHLARVDFFVDGEDVLVNELNTMPGFTPTSAYAKLMEHAGIAYPQLVERLCRLALERHRRRRTTPA